MNINKFYKPIKILIIFISFFFLFINSKENYFIVLNKLTFDVWIIVTIILIVIIMQNLINIRSFYFLKFTSNYNAKFSEWSSLFFLTGLINHSPLWGAGHIIRSYEMKKNNFSHKEYLNMYIFIFFWGILIYSFLLFLSSLFIIDFNFYISIALLILFLFSTILTSKIVLRFCIKILNKLRLYEPFIKKNFLNFLSKEFTKMAKLSFLTSSYKVFIVFFFTSLLICLDFFLLNTIFKFLFNTFDFHIFFLFFLSNFLIRTIKPIDNIIGLKEVILGFYGEQLGMLFLEAALIVVILRLVGLISLIINYIIYRFLNKFNY
jgi:hypothetical protein